MGLWGRIGKGKRRNQQSTAVTLTNTDFRTKREVLS